MHILKVAITGPESSGKSVLTEALAREYNAPWAEEFARGYLKDSSTPYTMADLIRISEGQLALEMAAVEASDTICFFDTDMLVLKVWAQYRFGKVPRQILNAWERSTYDLTLLCKPDLPWMPDPLRESPDLAERERLYDIYRAELIAAQKPYVEIEGSGAARQNAARIEVNQLLG